jgi:hypothetical protein
MATTLRDPIPCPTVDQMTANDGGGQKRVARGERPRHSFRCDETRWAAFKAKAARRGETVTKVLLRKIDEYLGEPD